MGPKPRGLKSREPQPNDISLYESLAIVFFKALFCFIAKELEHDIGLIKLKHPIEREDKGQYWSTNTLCLPNASTTMLYSGPVFISGWGKVKYQEYRQLQIGTFLIGEHRSHQFHQSSTTALHCQVYLV